MACVSVLLYCGLIAIRNQHSMASEVRLWVHNVAHSHWIKGGSDANTIYNLQSHKNINQPLLHLYARPTHGSRYDEMVSMWKRSMIKMLNCLHSHHERNWHTMLSMLNIECAEHKTTANTRKYTNARIQTSSKTFLHYIFFCPPVCGTNFQNIRLMSIIIIIINKRALCLLACTIE